MQNPQFVKAYHEAKLERKLDEMLEDLKEKNNKECTERGSFTSYRLTSTPNMIYGEPLHTFFVPKPHKLGPG